MKLLIVILVSWSLQVYSAVPELFGSSASSIAIGNQAEAQSAANNYYAPSLLGYSKRTQFSFNAFYINTDFEDIKNVVVKNETNTVNRNERGDPEVNPTPTLMFSAHLSTPIFSPDGPKLNFSFFGPFDRLMEADSGDPLQPKYVMYESRIIRPVIIFTASQAFGDWSFGGGVQTGFQTNGETYFMTRTTENNPSLAKMSFNAKPSIAAIASVAKKTKEHTSYFTFQQAMKSHLTNRATGETETGGNASFQFDFDIDALIYYDPMILRLGHQIQKPDQKFYFSLEFQQWDQYDPPTLKLKKRGGVINGSKDYDKIWVKNIFIPKIGYEKNLSEKWIGKIGYFYRPTPIDTDRLDESGNSLDSDKHVGSLGLAHLFNVYGKTVSLDLAYQGHFLKEFDVKKTPNREDGSTDQEKIGSPGYTVGGMIHVLSAGLSWMY